MNSVEQARAKKKAAGMGFGAPTSTAPPIAANSGSSSSGTFQRTKPIPSPPPPPQQRIVTPPGEDAAAGGPGGLSRQHNASFGRKALPSIPQGAVHQSPKTRRVQQMLDGSGLGHPGRLDDDADDDMDAILRRIDRDNGASSNEAGTPTDPMDALNAEDFEAATQAFGRRITPEYLRQHTGVEDLHLVTSTELMVDSRVTTAMDAIGELMPRLHEIRLSHSRIPIFRDLGTKYAELQVLYLNNAHVEELRGISACRKLRELYLAFNLLQQISDIGALEALEVVDLEANRITQAVEVGYLSHLSSLRSLCMEGNPVCSSLPSTWEPLDHEEGPSDLTQRRGMTFRQYVAARLPQLDRIDDVLLNQERSTGGVSRAVYADPMTSDLAKELALVQSSVRQNVRMNGGLEGAIEGQNRSLYSRQSTSCSGARRRTPASQSTPRSSAAVKAEITNRVNVNSAPADSSTPQKGTSAASSAADALAVPSAVNPLDRRSFLSSSGNASLLTSGAAISGSLAKSLRRRLPTIAGVPKPVAAISDESLSRLRHAVDAPGSDSPRTLREHELVDHINRMKASRLAGEIQKEAEAMASVHVLLEEMGLEMDLECAMGDEDDGLEQLRQQELTRLLQEERPKFLEAYRDRMPEAAPSGEDDDESDRLFGTGKVTDEELIREVAKLKQRTLRDLNTALVEDPQQFESLQMEDLGGDEEDVL